MTEKDKVHSKVDIKIGDLSFSAEGEPAWLSEQVAKVIEAAAKIGTAATAAPAGALPPGRGAGDANTLFSGSLSAAIKATGGDNKQVRRFLATAAWLHERGETNLKASTVASALSTHHQKGLANPNDCLNQNVAKGYCEKTKEGFFITPEGWSALGAPK